MYKEDLDFINEMIKLFESDPTILFYFNKEYTLVAFRWGMDNDCIRFMRLDGEVAFLHNVVPPIKLETTVLGEGGQS